MKTILMLLSPITVLGVVQMAGFPFIPVFTGVLMFTKFPIFVSSHPLLSAVINFTPMLLASIAMALEKHPGRDLA